METELNQIITKELYQESYTYEQFLQLVEKLYEAGKTTNGDNTSSMLDYTKLSIQRMNRITKSTELDETYLQSYKANERNMRWLLLNEGWCGDSGQSLPYINKIAKATPGVELRIVLRDQNPELMDLFLTNGTRSIPKLIMLDAETEEVIGIWGPRPVEAQRLFQDLKNNEELNGSDRSRMLHTWYAKNKGKDLQREFAEIIKGLNN